GFYSDGAIPGRAVLGGTHQLRGYPRYSLAGSRVWLVNQEWRFPILHGLAFAFPFGQLRFPGIQGALFVDAGSSWLEDHKPDGAWTSAAASRSASHRPSSSATARTSTTPSSTSSSASTSEDRGRSRRRPRCRATRARPGRSRSDASGTGARLVSDETETRGRA